ncbi:MAG: hypothetical protein HGGPFJEG_00416 [Ignavibacteria bacterium]|nr:hypothetical protein [Ignavibacteria bacterium]MBV6477674.1 hypothetical protein [Ignavibacteria bacterium]
METYKTKTKIKKSHKLELEDIPFDNGEEVEVTISKVEKKSNGKYTLRGSLIKYDEPFEPIDEDDWEALK